MMNNTIPSRAYNSNDLRTMEAELLKKMDKFNNEYGNYKKYLYNMRHNVDGDNSPKFMKPNNSPITTADFPDLTMDSPISLTPIYIDLVNSISTFNQALQYVDNHQVPAARSTTELESDELLIINMRNNLDLRLQELNEMENALSLENKQRLDASIVINLMWTTLVTSLIYYIVVHS